MASMATSAQPQLVAAAASVAVIALLFPPIRNRLLRILTNAATPSLYPRRWTVGSTKLQARPLRVMQWNILADGLSGLVQVVPKLQPSTI